jgi:hypothetical protein
MKSGLVILCSLFLLNFAYSQCGLTGMLPEILQNSSFPIQNVSGTSLSVSILNGNYPTTLGVEDNNGVPGNAKLFSPSEIGAIVTDVITQLGTYELRISNGTMGCVDTVEVAVVSVLPIIYSKPLEAAQKQNIINLTWSVATQINNDKYSIDHSKDGRNFSPIGEIAGMATSTRPNTTNTTTHHHPSVSTTIG